LIFVGRLVRPLPFEEPIMAKKSLGGCQPAERPAGDRTVETIRSFIVEGRDLGPEDYRAEVVPLIVSIASPATSGNDAFRALKTFNFMIARVRGLLELVAPMDEPLALVNSTDATKGVGNPTVSERRLMKAMNARLSLQNTDRNQSIFDHNAMPLSAIMPAAGGQPLDFGEAPHILPAGENMELDVALVQGSTNAADDTAVLGANTEYGVALEGWYVRVRGD
jgi:hypothetical protein